MENVCFCSLLYSENCVFCRITAHRTIHCSIMFLIHFMMFMTLSSQLLFVKLIKYAAWCNLWPFINVRIALYLASLNFFIWLGLSWFLRRRNHLWICLSENPVFLPKLSTSPCRVKNREHEGSVNGETQVVIDLLITSRLKKFSAENVCVHIQDLAKTEMLHAFINLTDASIQSSLQCKWGNIQKKKILC